jgi:hypothetical protein
MIIDIEESTFELQTKISMESLIKDVDRHNFETWERIINGSRVINDIKNKCWVESGYVFTKPEEYKLFMPYEVFCDYYLFGHNTISIFHLVFFSLFKITKL